MAIKESIKALREEHTIHAYAWPGGYPLFYITKDNGVLCPDCVEKEYERCIDPEEDQFYVIDVRINDEDPRLYCDHCNERIESSYGDDDDQDNQEED